jgi:hypothetical protein
LALDHRSALLVSEPNGFVAKQSMKTAGRGNPNNWAYSAQHPSPWHGSSEQISLDHVGWEATKILAGAIVFLLDFPFYRTSQELCFCRMISGFRLAIDPTGQDRQPADRCR